MDISVFLKVYKMCNIYKVDGLDGLVGNDWHMHGCSLQQLRSILGHLVEQ